MYIQEGRGREGEEERGKEGERKSYIIADCLSKSSRIAGSDVYVCMYTYVSCFWSREEAHVQHKNLTGST